MNRLQRTEIAIFRFFRIAFVGLMAFFLATSEWQSNASSQSEFTPVKVQSNGLPNLIQAHRGIYSGGIPKGERAFQELKALGVKTIISVDGATPDVSSAAVHGMRYVHLPHGYDGVPESCQLQLAKAINELPGPVYVHCHHGRHRSPAATAAACIALGLYDNHQGTKLLEMAQTGKNYVGLFASVATAKRMTQERLSEVAAQFVEVAERKPLVESMIRIDDWFSQIEEITKALSNSTTEKSLSDRRHAALLLSEEFREWNRLSPTSTHNTDYRRLIDEAAEISQQLKDSIETAANEPIISHLFDRLGKNCRACHERFRDNP